MINSIAIKHKALRRRRVSWRIGICVHFFNSLLCLERRHKGTEKKFEIRNPKHETNPNDQNYNVSNDV